jgi:hypothetical protein
MLIIKARSEKKGGLEGWLRKKFLVGRGFRSPHGDKREKNSHTGWEVNPSFY